jgi:hypothetical protein
VLSEVDGAHATLAEPPEQPVAAQLDWIPRQK